MIAAQYSETKRQAFAECETYKMWAKRRTRDGNVNRGRFGNYSL